MHIEKKYNQVNKPVKNKIGGETTIIKPKPGLLNLTCSSSVSDVVGDYSRQTPAVCPLESEGQAWPSKACQEP